MAISPEHQSILTKLVGKKLPSHVAVIMDGNNRWSKAQKNTAASGHREGAKAARRLVNLCAEKKIEYLTLFAFSSENWLRPDKEVKGLLALFLNVLKRNEVDKLHKNNIRLCFIGNRSRFSEQMQKLMKEAEVLTEDNTGLRVMVAADYGGQWDIVNACRGLAKKVADGLLSPDEIDSALFQDHICSGDLPMPDLCIRTGGDQRISNFLLWQFAYTELYFSNVLWPDFSEFEFDVALLDFVSRQRRFGMVSEQVE